MATLSLLTEQARGMQPALRLGEEAARACRGLVAPLLRRCMQASARSAGAAAAAQLLQRLEPEQVCDVSMPAMSERAASDAATPAPALLAIGAQRARASAAAPLSLEAMEQMLSTGALDCATASASATDVHKYDSAANAPGADCSNEDTAVAWEECTQWTPCALGTLPGYSCGNFV
jgi:hypothetical protein